MEKTETKLLAPTIDVVFQLLFGEVGSERITKSFLEDVLEEKIDSVDLSENPILRRQKMDDKMGVLDVLAKINGKEYCNVEMQVAEQEYLAERMLLYWARKYASQIKKGNEYEKLERTILILITDFKMPKIKGLPYHTKWNIIEVNERKVVLTNKLEFHILELPKIKNEEGKRSELIDWLTFMKNPNSERVAKKMSEKKELKEAYDKLVYLSGDAEIQRIAELRESYQMEKNASYSTGLHKGEKIGEKKGELKSQKEIAKKLKSMNVDVDIIEKSTGLAKEEINKL